MIKHKTREQWLNACADEILRKYRENFEMHFGSDGVEHLQHLKVSTGFPSRGGLASSGCARRASSRRSARCASTSPTSPTASCRRRWTSSRRRS